MPPNVVLFFAPESNGEVAYRGFKERERQVGLPLADLAESYRGVRYDFADLGKQPRRILTSPCWSGIVNNGRAYTGYAHERRASGPVAHAYRTPAPLSRSRGISRFRRVLPHV